jgi:hypothetical protein
MRRRPWPRISVISELTITVAFYYFAAILLISLRQPEEKA